MVDPPRRKPYQIGVQGGFMVIRPNATDFDRYVETILSGGNFATGAGWGGSKLGYGGYYGAGTIQGLASYYYGHLEQNRSLELNRCHYNTMVDEPTNLDRVKANNKTKLMCKTLEPVSQCQDCRKTDLQDIYTAHFTVCGKPSWCQWSRYKEDHRLLCMELFREWHKVRRSLEDEWKSEYPKYDPVYEIVNVTDNYTHYLNFSQGHCRAKRGYIRMEFPAVFEKSPSEEML
jgi:regulator of replication initiation timing